jgi:hypothetical protein
MAEHYAGTAKDIQFLIGNVLKLGTGYADISEQEIEPFLEDADDTIDSALSNTYLVPLKKCNWNGELVYPPPIPNIAKRIVAGNLMETKYSETQPNASILGKKMREEAQMNLAALVAGIGEGKEHLRGQILISKNIFARPTIVPKPVGAEVQETPAGGMGIK